MLKGLIPSCSRLVGILYMLLLTKGQGHRLKDLYFILCQSSVLKFSALR